jgi:hypothetical protein
VIVRRDLPRGLQGAMLVHAAGESSPGNLPEDTHAIVLSVPDEPALLLLAEKLAKFGVRHVTIREPDAPWNNALMAIGLFPARKETVRRHLSSLPLLK